MHFSNLQMVLLSEIWGRFLRSLLASAVTSSPRRWSVGHEGCSHVFFLDCCGSRIFSHNKDHVPFTHFPLSQVHMMNNIWNKTIFRMNIGSQDGAAFLFQYLLDKISSVFVFSPQFLCQLISSCLTGVTGVRFAGLSGSDYQRLKFSSTSTFDFAHINLHTGRCCSSFCCNAHQSKQEPMKPSAVPHHPKQAPCPHWSKSRLKASISKSILKLALC